jgi:hypothetical protein
MDLSSPTASILTRVQDICVQDTSEFQFQLNVAIGME